MYPITGEYNDDSKSVLSKIGVRSHEDNDAYDGVPHGDDEELLEVEEQCRGNKEDLEILI